MNTTSEFSLNVLTIIGIIVFFIMQFIIIFCYFRLCYDVRKIKHLLFVSYLKNEYEVEYNNKILKEIVKEEDVKITHKETGDTVSYDAKFDCLKIGGKKIK